MTWASLVLLSSGGGRVVRRCCVSYITGASNWYWLTAGQGLLSLRRVRVEGGCFYFFCFFTFIPVPLSSLSLSFISSTISSISFLPFSGIRHKMTLKGWRAVKPQHNQSIVIITYHLLLNKPYCIRIYWKSYRTSYHLRIAGCSWLEKPVNKYGW